MAMRKVLVVHRDETIRAELLKILETQGLSVRGAAHLLEAWAQIRTTDHPPDVILVAPATPGEDKFRAALRKYQTYAAIPVMPLTRTMVEGIRELTR